jgi:hypothetical protein
VEQAATPDARKAAPLHRIKLKPRSSVVSPPLVTASASASAAPDRIRFHDLRQRRSEKGGGKRMVVGGGEEGGCEQSRGARQELAGSGVLTG